MSSKTHRNALAYWIHDKAIENVEILTRSRYSVTIRAEDQRVFFVPLSTVTTDYFLAQEIAKHQTIQKRPKIDLTQSLSSLIARSTHLSPQAKRIKAQQFKKKESYKYRGNDSVLMRSKRGERLTLSEQMLLGKHSIFKPV